MQILRRHNIKAGSRLFAKLSVCLCCLPLAVFAQTLSFDAEEDTASNVPAVQTRQQVQSGQQKVVFKKAQSPSENNQQNQGAYFKAPQKNVNTPDSQNVQIKPVSNGYSEQTANKGAIKIYMRQFKVSQSLSGFVTCSMKLYVQSTLPNPISNLSFRLKWPTLETPVSFDDIPANATVNHGHSFVGNVCYSLDAVPNIIVNRCRVKNMSQQECANAIEWIK